MIHDLKIAIAGWYLSLANDFISRNEDGDLAWDQPELADIMTRNNITKEDIYSAIPGVWTDKKAYNGTMPMTIHNFKEITQSGKYDDEPIVVCSEGKKMLVYGINKKGELVCD